ncbi:MAG: hypothetical protein F6J89_02105 [Symploca sp. SIO1C4]|uniref:Uncharacterized protein n=1 Tax=Symploca sp. SIO1C4 TaxID=2607765 RepID=A0A6B3N8I6_9CYAN|nr:hypothetical protein [Symploca sp. SIO1C4]
MILPEGKNIAQLLEPGQYEDDLISDERRVAIVAALVNPVGSENQAHSTGRPEMVYLLNRSTQGISLGG